MKIITNAHELPPGEHFAILTFRSVTIPGDERSRTHPGHGYPESTEHCAVYTLYETKDDWEEEIYRRSQSRWDGDFVPLMVTVPTIKTTITVA
jgi:hypothetical protein